MVGFMHGLLFYDVMSEEEGETLARRWQGARGGAPRAARTAEKQRRRKALLIGKPNWLGAKFAGTQFCCRALQGSAAGKSGWLRAGFGGRP